MRDYIRSVHETTKLILNKVIDATEIERFSKSDTRWAKWRNKDFNRKAKYKKGTVYQIDFGKNFVPEMSYEHRGLVIGTNKQLLYVLPIYTYRSSKHYDIYHPENNPKGNHYLLKASDYQFIKHDSLLKLNDLRTISTKRIIYEQKDGVIDSNSPEFKTILELVATKYFPTIMHEFKNLQQVIKNTQ